MTYSVDLPQGTDPDWWRNFFITEADKHIPDGSYNERWNMVVSERLAAYNATVEIVELGKHIILHFESEADFTALLLRYT